MNLMGLPIILMDISAYYDDPNDFSQHSWNELGPKLLFLGMAATIDPCAMYATHETAAAVTRSIVIIVLRILGLGTGGLRLSGGGCGFDVISKHQEDDMAIMNNEKQRNAVASMLGEVMDMLPDAATNNMTPQDLQAVATQMVNVMMANNVNFRGRFEGESSSYGTCKHDSCDGAKASTAAVAPAAENKLEDSTLRYNRDGH
ncbi:hypothetical protein BC830DRAFT_1217766 [Chytriomyces sp. MP71]|nr:hypothetical protein BC830DRAFT_1217766 [Chytriomyces sp. MP71]